ncbi:hypothetical protein [Microvirga guangxiensis]|uniref:Uncharacterized protein n=1 Tax=Microvirga guangxiensis TaxID=549386 RepID=A0A1G5IUN9_9HYPH|nr:hypothetical protein [Microvirga guangxiensis]SCY79441.1 hypothetical protein SAMN02927923_02308 [Microvirga guangxiensis]
MPHEAYCVAYRDKRWSVLHRGRDLGAFYFRTNALKFAVTSAYRSGADADHAVYVLDRNGALYTAWNWDRDYISVDAD